MIASLSDGLITLEPVSPESVDLLIQWTLDPVAQGPYKRVPSDSHAALHELFLDAPDRQYFLIRRMSDDKPLGRLYFRAWHFHENPALVDWELNILIADPAERGKGVGTACQRLAADYLLGLPETHSVFAYTMAANTAERRALVKAGFTELGLLPSEYYRISGPPEPSILYVLVRADQS